MNRTMMMNKLPRRGFGLGLAGLLWTIASLALVVPVSHGEEDNLSATPRPNFVLMMADDLGWGDTGYNGHPHIKTPVLDKMAAAGVRFERFYAAHNLCSPTRTSFLTGRNANRAGVYLPGIALPADEITLAHRLRKAGYATGHFGKWHLGSVIPDSPTNPGAFGFDEWVSGMGVVSGVNPILSRNGKAEPHQGEGSLVIAKEATEFIRRHAAAKRPFLAVVWFGAVHGPACTTQEFLDLYPDAEDKGHRAYYGMTTAVDTAIGEIRQALQDAGVWENTFTLFCSDNGGCGPWSVTGGRGKKAMMYEGGLRVPGIVEWPAKFSRPAITHLSATTSDIFPTCLAAAGLAPGGDRIIDGINLLPLLQQNDTERPAIGFWSMVTKGDPAKGKPNNPGNQNDYGYMRPMLALQQAGKPLPPELFEIATGLGKTPWPEGFSAGHAAWLDWPWKLHRIQTDEKNIKWELYNLADDPLETRDQSNTQPDRVGAMRTGLEAWQKAVIRSLNQHKIH